MVRFGTSNTWSLRVYSGLKILCVILVSIVIFSLFVIISFVSPTFRDFIVWFEPKVQGFLFGIAILAIAYALFKHQNKILNSPNKVKEYCKKLQFVLRILLPSLSLVLFTLPLFRSWTDVNINNQNNFAIGGLIPYSDSAYYYAGTQRLIIDGRLDSCNQRRPFNASLFSVRLALAKHDFRIAMIFQSVLLGLAFYWTVKIITKDIGIPTGLIFSTLLFAYGRMYVSTTMTESLGFTFGALSFAVMWNGLSKQNHWLVMVGLSLLTLALGVRAGAMLILPCILIWAIITFKKTKLTRIGIAVIGIFAILSGFLITALVVKLYGGSVVQTHGDLSYFLYGLANGNGNVGWRQIGYDYPYLFSGDYDKDYIVQFTYEKAIEKIKENPFNLIIGIGQSFVSSLIKFVIHIAELTFGIVPYNSPIRVPLDPYLPIKLGISILFILIVYVGLIRFMWVNRRDRRSSFIMLGLLGTIMSLPIIYPYIYIRVLSSTFPFIALSLSFGITCWYSPLKEKPIYNSEKNTSLAPLVMGLCLTLTAIVGPAIVRHFDGIKLIGNPSPINEGRSVISWLGPGSPYLDILPSSSSVKTFAPVVKECDLKANTSNLQDDKDSKILQNINAPATLVLVHDPNSTEFMYLLGPSEIIGKTWRLIRFYIEPIQNSNSFFRILRFEYVNQDTK